MARPYPVTPSMLLLVSLIPFYIFLPVIFPPATRHAPELPIDRIVPVVPVWSLVYGALYLFLILLPVFVVRHEGLIRSTVRAYLLVWITAYVFFTLYPTIAPRPDEVVVTGFASWGLRALYGMDPPYNCFPSLHVAHSFVSAFAAHRVHHRTGVFAIVCAILVGVSTIYTRQHYIVDVLGGTLLASIAYLLFLRGRPKEGVPQRDRDLAPVFAAGLTGLIGLVVIVCWIVYELLAPSLLFLAE